MSQFDKFKKEFDSKYKNIYDFMDKLEYKSPSINCKIVEEKDEITYDSYGNEDSSLCRVLYFEDYDIYVMFSGTRQSYNGEEWNLMKEVKPVTKTIQTYE